MANLFSEIKLRDFRIKNRIVMPPMVNFGYPTRDGFVTEEHVQHYAERAKGGVGLIIIEATCINKSGRLAEKQLGLWSDDFITGFRRIAEACHQYGAVVTIQIHHAGIGVPPGITDDPVGPSDFSGQSKFGSPVTGRALTAVEIREIEEQFIAAAVRAQKTGLDGIELHAAHGYLLSQFLSPITNKRIDEYGGTLVKRTRIVKEIITGIRKAVGDHFIIGCRIGSNEPDLESGIRIAQELDQSGLDIIHVSSGMDTLLKMDDQMGFPVPANFPYNWIAYGGTEIKKKVRTSVIACNGIRTPERANYFVENGLADFAAIGKSLLVNPNWATLAQNNMEVIVCLECRMCSRFRPGGVCPQDKLIKKTGAK
jgi:2,4-dienoyl-CoA reductase-like NADH-dependent reductase (Old Yellow Enzyme family)